MKKTFWIMSGVFGVLTIIFYITSINQLDRETARLLGTSATINIQGTVFCAACAVACVINVCAGLISMQLENQQASDAAASSASGDKILKAVQELSNKLDDQKAKQAPISVKSDTKAPATEKAAEKVPKQIAEIIHEAKPKTDKDSVSKPLFKAGVVTESGKSEFVQEMTGQCDLCKKKDLRLTRAIIRTDFSELHRNICKECFEKKAQELNK